MRTTSRCASAPSAQVASNSTVSFEKPVAAGISIAPTHTSSSPATPVSHAVSCRAVSSGSRARAPTARDATPEAGPERPRVEIARGPNPRQDGGFDVDDKRIAMEIALSDDQEFFRDTTRKFLGSECPIPKVRALRSNPDGFERDYWRQGAELGWTSLLVPEDLGGGSVSGNGAADLALVADAFGAHVAPGPLAPVQRRGRHAVPLRERRAAGRVPPRHRRRRRRRHLGLHRGAASRRARRHRPPRRGRRVRVRPHGGEITGRGGRARPTSCSSPRRPTPVPPSSSCLARRRG